MTLERLDNVIMAALFDFVKFAAAQDKYISLGGFSNPKEMCGVINKFCDETGLNAEAEPVDYWQGRLGKGIFNSTEIITMTTAEWQSVCDIGATVEALKGEIDVLKHTVQSKEKHVGMKENMIRDKQLSILQLNEIIENLEKRIKVLVCSNDELQSKKNQGKYKYIYFPKKLDEIEKIFLLASSSTDKMFCTSSKFSVKSIGLTVTNIKTNSTYNRILEISLSIHVGNFTTDFEYSAKFLESFAESVLFSNTEPESDYITGVGNGNKHNDISIQIPAFMFDSFIKIPE